MQPWNSTGKPPDSSPVVSYAKIANHAISNDTDRIKSNIQKNLRENQPQMYTQRLKSKLIDL